MEAIKVSIGLYSKEKQPERIDIIKNLPAGVMVQIAQNVGCVKSHVSNILHGKYSIENELTNKVLLLAQFMAAVNIWNQRFCKSQPTINPLKITI